MAPGGVAAVAPDSRRQPHGRRRAQAADIRGRRAGGDDRCSRPRFWPMLMRGSRGLAESYAREWWDSPDLVAVIRLAARNAVLIDRVRAIERPAVGAAPARPGADAPPHPAAQPARCGRALRPRQRAVSADARPDDDVLLRAVRAARDDASGGVGGQAGAGLRAPPDRTRGSRPGDWDRLGRLRRPRRRHPWLPRGHHHNLLRAARLRPGAGAARRPARTGSPC